MADSGLHMHVCTLYTQIHITTTQKQQSLESRTPNGSCKIALARADCKPAWPTFPTGTCAFAEYTLQGPVKIRPPFPSCFSGHLFSFRELSASILKSSLAVGEDHSLVCLSVSLEMLAVDSLGQQKEPWAGKETSCALSSRPCLTLVS